MKQSCATCAHNLGTIFEEGQSMVDCDSPITCYFGRQWVQKGG